MLLAVLIIRWQHSALLLVLLLIAELLMKWVKRVLGVLLLLVIGGGIYAVATALRSDKPVGFQLVQVPDGAGGGFPAGVWYPTAASPRPTTLIGLQLMSVAPDAAVAGKDLPLVVISHGNGGGPGSHADLAMALAAAGYVVAAPMHPGDNFLDQSALATPGWLPERSRQLRLATDYLLAAWPGHDRIDAARVGAYGFSAGGFTVLTAVGARPDLGLIPGHCARQPEFVCDLLRQAKSPLLPASSAGVPAVHAVFQADPRIRAAVVAAPGLGFTMAGQGLAQVGVPVQLWSADDDANEPYATNAGAVRAGLGPHVEFHAVPGARHMSFLAPCGPIGPPAFCAESGKFDRKVFHASMNASVIDFFNRNLGVKPAMTSALR
jgi:predicted dienelactone hydrolase